MITKLWIAEWKQYFRQLPRVLAASLLLLLLGGSACYGCIKLLYSGEQDLKASAAIVTDDPDNVYLDFILQILQGGGQEAADVSFLFMDEQEAYQALRNRSVVAVLIFPEGAVEGILNGTNDPIRAVFASGTDLAATLLREITNTLGSLLSSAQAGTYTASGVFTSLEREQLLAGAFQSIDTINFSYVLTRTDLFDEIPVTFGAASSLSMYYASSLLLFLSLLSGIGFSAALHFKPDAFCRTLRSRGITTGKYYALRFLAYQCFSFACLLLLYLAAIPASGLFADRFRSAAQIRFSGSVLLMLLLFSIFLSAFAQFSAAVSPSPPMFIMFSFLLGTGLLACSGGLLPAAFLPEAIRANITLFPSYVMQQAVVFLLSGQDMRQLFQTDVGITQSLLYLLPCSATLYAAGLGILNLRMKD